MTRTGGGPVGGSTSIGQGVLQTPAAAASGVWASVLAAASATGSPEGGGDVGPSKLATPTSSFAGGADPPFRRRVGGGGGGDAMTAARCIDSRSPRCTQVPTRGTVRLFLPGVGGRSRDAIVSSSDKSDMSPKSSFNFSRLLMLEASEKLWAVEKPLPSYRSLGQRYCFGIGQCVHPRSLQPAGNHSSGSLSLWYRFWVPNRRMSTPVVLLSLRCRFWISDYRVTTPVVLPSYGVGSGALFKSWMWMWRCHFPRESRRSTTTGEIMRRTSRGPT